MTQIQSLAEERQYSRDNSEGISQLCFIT